MLLRKASPLLLLVALAAFASPAQAAVGTTAFTCQNVGSGGHFSREHCAAADATAEGKFEHVAIAEGTTTELSLSNERTGSETASSTNFTFEMTLLENAFEIVATGAKGSGTVVNRKTKEGEHIVEGTATIEYTGAVVKGGAIIAGCKVKEGRVVTKELAIASAGQGMSLKLSPASGEEFAVLTLEGCTIIPGVNGSHPFKGSVNATPDGATATFNRTATTSQESLHYGAAKVGVEGTLTLSARAEAKAGYTPLSFTTVEK